MGAETRLFNGAPIPKGVKYWSLKTIDGTRCTFPTDEGADAAEFPVGDLSVETIRAAWGAGSYRVQFIGERDGKRKPLGSKVVIVHAAEVPTDRPAGPAPAAPEDPMVRAFQIVDAIDRRAATAAQRDRDFLQAVLAAGSSRQGDLESLAMRIEQGIGSRLSRVVGQIVGGGAEEEDDDEDDEEDDDDDGASAGPFQVGHPMAETAAVEALNGFAKTLSGLAPALQELAFAKLADMAEEAKAKAAARHASLNGGQRVEVAQAPPVEGSDGAGA